MLCTFLMIHTLFYVQIHQVHVMFPLVLSVHMADFTHCNIFPILVRKIWLNIQKKLVF